jgi:hypothetical protein
MKNLIILLCLLPAIFACEDVSDPRDKLEGKWKISVDGNILLLQNSKVINSVELSEESVINIFKSYTSDDKIEIDGVICTMSGNDLIFNAETKTQTDDGLLMQITTMKSGSVSYPNITINETYSGTWQYGSNKGTIAGSSTYTLRKVAVNLSEL